MYVQEVMTLYSNLLYAMGQYFLDMQYIFWVSHLGKCIYSQLSYSFKHIRLRLTYFKVLGTVCPRSFGPLLK